MKVVPPAYTLLSGIVLLRSAPQSTSSQTYCSCTLKN